MKLTDEHRKMVEDNHNLIYSFAYTKNIDVEMYYDILAIGLCRAVTLFDESKGTLSTFSYLCMYHAYLMEKRKENRRPITCNYDTIYLKEDFESVIKQTEYELYCSEILDKCKIKNQEEREIMWDIMMGMKGKELYDKYQMRSATISRIRKKYKDIIRKEVELNDSQRNG